MFIRASLKRKVEMNFVDDSYSDIGCFYSSEVR